MKKDYQKKYVSVKIPKKTYLKAKRYAKGRCFIVKVIDEALNNYLLLKKIK